MAATILNRWKALPKDLIFAITKRLGSRVYILRLRAVCHSFRTIFPLPPKTILANPDLKLPFPEGYFHSLKCGHFVLTEATVYAIQPLTKITNLSDTTKTWLFKLQESVFNPDTVRVKDPLSRYVVDSLPSRLPDSINMLDYRVKEVAKAYALELFALDEGETRHYEFKEGLCLLFEKVDVSIRDGGQFSIAAVMRGGLVVVWRSEVKQWDYVHFWDTIFVDLVYHNQKFYALGKKGEIISVDCISLAATEHATLMMTLEDGSRRSLKLSNDLFLIEKRFVDLYNDQGFSWVEELDYPYRCKVLKLYEEKHSWVPVKHLGSEDRVFFLGDDGAYSVSAKEFPSCKPNCIYFAENTFDRSPGTNDHPGSDAGMYDFDDNFAGPLWSFTYYCNLFWPPPPWLSQTTNAAPP